MTVPMRSKECYTLACVTRQTPPGQQKAQSAAQENGRLGSGGGRWPRDVEFRGDGGRQEGATSCARLAG